MLVFPSRQGRELLAPFAFDWLLFGFKFRIVVTLYFGKTQLNDIIVYITGEFENDISISLCVYRKWSAFGVGFVQIVAYVLYFGMNGIEALRSRH
jgi:hypothetical protein